MDDQGEALPGGRAVPALSLARARAVNAVYETGSFAAAGRRLCLSQPAVTQLVRDLERDFGVLLFDRRGTGVVPTAVGEALRPATLRLEASEAEARAVLADHRGHRGGELRIGLGNAMPGMAMIRAFQAQHPRIQVSVVMGDFGTIVAAVEAQRVDVGLLPEVPEDGRFRREVCLTQRVVAIAPPDHPLAGRPAVACRDLADGRLVFRPRSSSTQRVVDRAFRRAGLQPRPALVLDTRDGVVEAVANGLGIGFMWALASSRTDGLARLSLTEAPDEMPEHVFALASRRNALVDLFFETRHRMTLEPHQAAWAG